MGVPTARLVRMSALAAWLLAGGMAAAMAADEDNRAGSDEPMQGDAFDCRTLETQPAPETALEWFERSLWAGHCYAFDANAVRIGHDGVRTLALTHEVQDGVERGVAHFLDGPPLVVERRGRIGRIGWAGGRGDVAPSPAGIAAHLDGVYRLQLGGQERIANRRTQRLDISPLDSMRFGHRLWIDITTGLTLKQTLLDESGRVVETFQFTEFADADLHQGEVVFDQVRHPPDDPWATGWLPKGFMAQPVDTRSARHGEQVVHRLYSDGLSTMSLFVEPLGTTDVLAPGLHRLGVSHAAVRHRELGGEIRQVVVMGELPPRVLFRVADTLEWHDDSS